MAQHAKALPANMSAFYVGQRLPAVHILAAEVEVKFMFDDIVKGGYSPGNMESLPRIHRKGDISLYVATSTQAPSLKRAGPEGDGSTFAPTMIKQDRWVILSNTILEWLRCKAKIRDIMGGETRDRFKFNPAWVKSYSIRQTPGFVLEARADLIGEIQKLKAQAVAAYNLDAAFATKALQQRKNMRLFEKRSFVATQQRQASVLQTRPEVDPGYLALYDAKVNRMQAEVDAINEGIKEIAKAGHRTRPRANSVLNQPTNVQKSPAPGKHGIVTPTVSTVPYGRQFSMSDRLSALSQQPLLETHSSPFLATVGAGSACVFS
ncbi:hypothetical protein EMMF5_004059 [Cystobasidiomycetes sp. EMM_F5]